jgi:hypothetical protein
MAACIGRGRGCNGDSVRLRRWDCRAVVLPLGQRLAQVERAQAPARPGYGPSNRNADFVEHQAPFSVQRR